MAESSDDEDVPVAGLGKSHAEAAPEAAPAAATPSTKDSDDDSDDVVGGVMGRLAQKRSRTLGLEPRDKLRRATHCQESLAFLDDSGWQLVVF